MCVCVRAFSGRAAAVRAGYRTGTYGLLGLSWLSERLKGRPFSGGSTREHRPLSLLFVASWRPAFKAQALPLPFKCKVKIMKSGRDKKKKNAFAYSNLLWNKDFLAHAENIVGLLFCNGWLHAV